MSDWHLWDSFKHNRLLVSSTSINSHYLLQLLQGTNYFVWATLEILCRTKWMQLFSKLFFWYNLFDQKETCIDKKRSFNFNTVDKWWIILIKCKGTTIFSHVCILSLSHTVVCTFYTHMQIFLIFLAPKKCP